MMTNKNITSFIVELYKDDKPNKRILSHSERFLVEKYRNVLECGKSVRKRIKKAKSDHYYGIVLSKTNKGEMKLVCKF